MRRVKLFCSLIMLLVSQGAQTVSYPLPSEGSRLVGSTLAITVPQGNTESPEAFAVQHRQGLNNTLEVNSGADVSLPKSGSMLAVPQQLILPDTAHEGTAIDVAEMRLYYYPADSNTAEILPIGIGQTGRGMPRNWVTAVERRQETPSWTPTPDARREYAARGESLPAFVPAGSENPMGLYAIYIGRLYAIHGTNTDSDVGLWVGRRYIRLRNDDIRYLSDTVPVGARVQLIDRPVKHNERPDGNRWVEVHRPLSRNHSEYESDGKVPLPITPALRTLISGNDADVSRGSQALERHSGMPVNVSLAQKHY